VRDLERKGEQKQGDVRLPLWSGPASNRESKSEGKKKRDKERQRKIMEGHDKERTKERKRERKRERKCEKQETSEWQHDIPTVDANKLPQNHVSLHVSGIFQQNCTQHTLHAHGRLLQLEYSWVKAHCHH
jgi:hypothetical protein